MWRHALIPSRYWSIAQAGTLGMCGGLIRMKRWMAEISYRTERDTDVITFEEIEELHTIIELGPDWHDIVQITLNRPVLQPEPEPAPIEMIT